MPAKSPPITLVSLLALWMASGCGACTSPVSTPGSKVPGQCSSLAPSLGVQKTDILFIIDNSESMADKQAEVARETPAFVQVLQQQNAGVRQDFQIGLITTSVYLHAFYDAGQPVGNQVFWGYYSGQMGRLQPVPDAGPDGGIIPNSGTETILSGNDPQLVDKFSRLVQVGIDGSGQETPFEAMRLATTYWNDVPAAAGGNQGFLRDGAQLLAITVMDEDDCSEMADLSDAGWQSRVLIGVDKNRGPNFDDYCTDAGFLLTPPKTYFDIFRSLVDSTGAPRPVIWADIGPVGIGNQLAAAVRDVDAGTLRNIDCPISFGPGFRHLAMAELFEPGVDAGSLRDLDSICDTNYHQDLVSIAQSAVANQNVEVFNVPDPALLVVDITRADGTVQACTVTGTTVNGQTSSDGNIAYEVSDAGQEYVVFLGTCERHFDDQTLAVELLCAN